MSRTIWHVVLVLLVGKTCQASLDVSRINGKEIVSQLLKLAKITEAPEPAVTRVLFTDKDMQARKYVKQLMTDAKLQIREDAMGNIFGRWLGSDKAAAVVQTGSHVDAIPMAGAYDGTLGVVGAIAAVKGLQTAGFKPRKPIEVIMFTSEEPTRFGLGCIGSRGMAGTLTAKVLDEKVDVNGTTFQEAATAAGYGGKSHEDILSQTLVKKGSVAAFVELHIEQGPLLEREGLNLGIVSAIAAPAALRMTFFGNGGHAGALLMPDRKDASLAAAELALVVEKVVLGTDSIDTVGTSGSWAIKPNTLNAVPWEAKLEIDIRDINGPRRDAVVSTVLKTAETIAKRRQMTHQVEMINQDPPATCSDQVVAAAEQAAKQLGASTKHLVSRAYHDSLFMAQIAPTGMIFIPCRNGWSHRPDEYSSPEDIERGVKALALTLSQLAGGATDSNSEL